MQLRLKTVIDGDEKIASLKLCVVYHMTFLFAWLRLKDTQCSQFLSLQLVFQKLDCSLQPHGIFATLEQKWEQKTK
jgi:hypothetical protein